MYLLELRRVMHYEARRRAFTQNHFLFAVKDSSLTGKRIRHPFRSCRGRQKQRKRTIEHERVCVEHDLVPAVRDDRGNLSCRLEPSQLQEAYDATTSLSDASKHGENGEASRTFVLFDSFTDQFGAAGLTLGPDLGRLLLLYSLVDEERRPLSGLLRDLLALDGGRERWRELRMRS